jgi:SAM-dependent methyltransferase
MKKTYIDNILSDDKLLDLFFNHLKSNRHLLFKVPEFRSHVSRIQYEKKVSLGAFSVSDSPDAIDNGLKHNLESLASMPGFDRGSILVDALFGLYKGAINPAAKFLCIGPRNEAELYSIVSHGVDPSNLYAIDLIGSEPFVVSGDMHNLPFECGTFDFIFVGWVLAYSNNIPKAISEIVRVAKDGAVVVLGADFDGFEQHDSHMALAGVNGPGLADTRKGVTGCAEDIFGLFSAYVGERILSRNPVPPYDAETRRVIAALRLNKKNMGLLSHQLNREKNAIVEAYQTLPPKLQEHPEIQLRLNEHLAFLDRYTQVAHLITQGYILMRRHHFQLGRALDRQISNSLGKVFTPQLALGNASRSMFSDSLTPTMCSEAVESMRVTGYWHAPIKVPLAIIQELTKLYNGLDLTKDGRNEVAEELLIANNSIRALWLDSFFLRVVEEYFGAMPVLNSVTGARSNAAELSDSKQDQDALFWHCDKDGLSVVKVFVYLSDVGQHHGPHEYIARSADNFQEMGGGDRRFTDDEVRAKYPAENFREVIAPAGTIFFADTTTLHRGTLVREGYRDLLQLQYSTSLFGAPHKPLAFDLIKEYGLLEFAKKFPRLFTRFQA